MFAWFRGRQRHGRTAHALYGAIVAASRQPELFRDIGVPDTVEGRFEVLVAHMFVFLERLRGRGAETEPVSQALVDAFFADMDTTARQLGVGDLAVPKKMRTLSAVFRARLEAYRAAMEAADPAALSAAVARNLGMETETERAGVAESFAAHMRNSLAALEREPVETLHEVRLFAGAPAGNPRDETVLQP